MISRNKTQIRLENGCIGDALAPVIVSASRSTDLPAFYSDWFFHRLKLGYSAWVNPFNGRKSYVSYQDTRFIVFWSKNPRPLLVHLPELKNRGINYYLQYTLNDYVSEGLENGLPTLNERLDTFREFVETGGKERVIWRYDPLVLTEKTGWEELLRKIEYVGDQLYGYTDKLVFSFADILRYRRVQSNLKKAGVLFKEWTELEMENFAKQLAALNSKWNFQLATCGEKVDLSAYGIRKNRCVDDDLIIRLAYDDPVLMKFLGVEIRHTDRGLLGILPLPPEAIPLKGGGYAIKTKFHKDRGQRSLCGCMVSKDIGEYHTCPHLCGYCYANTTPERVRDNFAKHQMFPYGETITG